ncbi:CLUMA_CG007952, isoform A [Clunio marinus]|uniref:CLUMA_CG007952, isoform A n=1 Tax=Clunio marinus TaxID=568069 RepID=A0A1J1I2D9_9DIPT|nr:CLUMA_CG007952, isoform A [Clunio marinus]
MGCGFSSSSSGVFGDPTSPEFRTNLKSTETVIGAFTRLDEHILTLENLSPGSRLTTAEAWVEHLEKLQLTVDDTITDRQQLDVISELDETILEDEKDLLTEVDQERNDIMKLAIKLQVANDVKKALEHEEFLGRISRGVMELHSEKLRLDMIEHGRKRIETLIESFNQLRELYLEQDNLIASISGGTYNSSLEQELDMELETAREIRDRLSGVAEQWRTSSNLLRAAAKAALQAFEFWSLVEASDTASERVQLALDTRDACQSSLTALSCAQQALPQVEIPFVTLRQSSAVKHALIYILTDMANEKRYSHTKTVMESFHTSATKAVEWIHATYKKTLDGDLTAQIDNIKVLTFRLRKERIKHYKNIVGNKVYIRPQIKP